MQDHFPNNHIGANIVFINKYSIKRTIRNNLKIQQLFQKKWMRKEGKDFATSMMKHIQKFIRVHPNNYT